MSLLLINAPILYENDNMMLDKPKSFIEMRTSMHENQLTFYPIEPLGLCSIMAYCMSLGVKAELLNCALENHRHIEESFASITSLKETNGISPILVGLTGSSSVFYENIAIARHCRELWPNVKIIIGGDFASLNYLKILEDFKEFDFVCVGDGEVLTYELMQSLEKNNRKFDEIAGLAWRDENKTIRYNTRDYIDINALPFPCRLNIPKIIKNGFTVAIYASRGCPYLCEFCNTSQIAHLPGKNANPYRLRQIDSIVNEIQFLQQNYSVNEITIVDDLFLGPGKDSKERAYQFAEEILKRNIKITYMMDCRYDAIDFKLLELLHKSGLRKIYVGIESGSQKQREIYKKQLPTSLQIVNQLKQVDDLGVEVVCGMITFHPYVTKDELTETLNLIDLLNQRKSLTVHELIPYPGTPIYKKLKADGILNEENWPIVTYELQNPVVREIYKFMQKTLQNNRNVDYKELEKSIRTLLDK